MKKVTGNRGKKRGKANQPDLPDVPSLAFTVMCVDLDKEISRIDALPVPSRNKEAYRRALERIRVEMQRLAETGNYKEMTKESYRLHNEKYRLWHAILSVALIERASQLAPYRPGSRKDRPDALGKLAQKAIDILPNGTGDEILQTMETLDDGIVIQEIDWDTKSIYWINPVTREEKITGFAQLLKRLTRYRKNKKS